LHPHGSALTERAFRKSAGNRGDTLTRLRRFLIVPTVLSILALAPAVKASHTQFATGDLFVGVGSSKVQWRHPDGSLNQTMTTPVSAPTTTGMALDLSHNLYVTGYTSNAISRFDTTGGATGTFGGGFNSHPESISFDTFGNAYVGQEGGSRDILKFDAAGTLVATFDAAPDGRKGTDRLDVGTDQCTIFYTGQSKAIRRFDACMNAQLSNFASGLPGKEAFDVKALIGGGVLVADTEAIHRLNPSGVIVQSYDQPGLNCWTALSLDTTTASFWAGDRCSSTVSKFSMASGAVLASFNAGPKTSVQGLAVDGGLTAATAADVSVAITDTPDPVSPSSPGEPTYVLDQATVANGGPGLARGVSFTATVSGGTIHQGSGGGWSCSPGATTVTCSRATALGINTEAAPINLVVQVAQEAASVVVSAQVSANEADPAPANNADSETTAVGQPVRNNVISFCPDTGCTLDTDPFNTGPMKLDNTITELDVEAGGEGSVVFINETFPAAFECGSASDDEEINFVAPEGHTDPSNPAVVTVMLHTSAGTQGRNTRPCTIKNRVVVEIPPCVVPGVADPAPCLDDVMVGGGVITTTTLWLSGDPPMKH
jgi:hypothetical protein